MCMDEQRIAALAAGLAQLRAEGLVAPKVPEPIWRELAGIVPQLAVEIMITGTGRDVLLVFRDDQDWYGWHVPGGWMACGESVEQAADRVARRELGVGVRVRTILGAFAWPEHPYASGLSLLCVGEADGKPAAGEFFTAPPQPLVPHHDMFLRMFFDQVPRHDGSRQRAH